MYKILIYKNKDISFDINDDIEKVKEYYKSRLPFELYFEVKDIDIKVEHVIYPDLNQDGRVILGTKNVKDKMKGSGYDCVMFAYDCSKTFSWTLVKKTRSKIYIPSITHSIPLKGNIEFVELAFDPKSELDKWTEHAIKHELMHVFCKALARKGIPVLDEMDRMEVNGKIETFYKDNEPEALDGNFARTLSNLKPHLGKLVQNETVKKWKYFTEKEVKGLSPDLVDKLDNARDIAGVPFRITSGLRTEQQNEKAGGVKNSAHLRGLAVDLVCTDGVSRLKIIKSLIQAGFERIGIAKTFIHADIDTSLPANIWLYD